jgi:predicted GNAT family acetyltransferase
MADELRPTKDPEVHDHPSRMRYEITFDGALAGYALYSRRGHTVTFTHTEIDPSTEGHGLGGRLAKAALDDVRSRSLRVVAQCPFIASYIERHPDYADLLDAPSSS